jgi:hypothetical protein
MEDEPVDPAEPAPVVVVVDEAEVRGAPAALEGPRPRAPDAPPVEVGGAAFLLAGVGPGGVVGLSAFVADPLSADVSLRISASVGRAPDSYLSTTWAGARLDSCYAVAGNYAAGQGLRLGLCGGFDVGVTAIGAGSRPGEPDGQTLPFVDLGPSVELGAELGPRATVLLRAALGLNIARGTFTDASGTQVVASAGTERAEVGFSWKLP